MESKHICYTNTQHTNDMDPLLATYMEDKKQDHKEKHGGQLGLTDGGYGGSVKPRHLLCGL